MTMTAETYTLWVCTDCHFAYHEGDYTPTEDATPWGLLDLSDGTPPLLMRGIYSGLLNSEHAEDCARRTDDDAECSFDGECEHMTFSWSACDGCGSRLGGDRHAYTQVAETTETTDQ